MRKDPIGFGLGLRTEHYDNFLDEQVDVDWLEIITENYLVPGGKPLYYLDKIRERYPMVMHGVSLSIGSFDPLNQEYLFMLRQLAERIKPEWISDHLCFTGIQGKNTHDLLPLAYTEEAIQHIVSRMQQVQDYLGRQILLENVSSYIAYHDSEMSEWEFITEISERADCLLLFDVNNVFVSALNHQCDPYEYINAIPKHRVQQIHLAGHSLQDDFRIDTHDHPVCNPVWDLYATTIERFGMVSTMIERDDNIPPLTELLDELKKAREIANHVLQGNLS